jgi:enoyl-CoA hydratase
MILMAGQKIDAQRAYDYGLIDQIVPDDDLLATAHLFMTDSIAATPEHAAAIKTMIGGN